MNEFTKGKRVELHPACDEWMQGDRYGVVMGLGRARAYWRGRVDVVRPVRVKLDKSGRVRLFHPDNLSLVEDR